MLSKTRAKFIISLQNKKVRDEEGLYLIEGDKIVKEYLLSGIPLRFLAAKPEFLSSLSNDQKRIAGEIEPVTFEDLKKISTLKTPHNAVAVAAIPETSNDSQEFLKSLCVVLDTVQDPGNLGTIIRSAAWFGIKNIVCSPDCADMFNPKVIQASMGAILHVNISYQEPDEFLKKALARSIPVYGALMDGKSIYDQDLEQKGIIVLGNESKGISNGIISLVTHKIMIPRFSDLKYGIDSLNVSMAATVIFSEFARRKKR